MHSLLSHSKRIYTLLFRGFIVLATLFFVLKLFSNLAFEGTAISNTYDIELAGKENIQKTVDYLKESNAPFSQAGLYAYTSFTCSFLGEACQESSTQSTSTARENSFVGKASKLLTYPYINPPASGIQSTYEALNNAHFLPQTYAAEGLGFGALKPFAKIWKVFRDIAYVFIVFFIVIVGFMVMFRMNIDPQTVITLENALPRMVITLIIITFSFAIAGFMIDLMMLTSALVISTLAKVDPSLIDAAKLQNDYLVGGPWAIYKGITPAKWADFWNLGGALVQVLPGSIELMLRFFAFIAAFPVNNFITNAFTEEAAKSFKGIAVVGNSLGGLIEGIASVAGSFAMLAVVILLVVAYGPRFIFSVFVLLTFFSLFLRLFFLLLFTYVRTLLLIIFAPFILLFEVFPGRNTFKFWLKALFGELMTFPVVIALIIVGRLMVLIMTSNPGNTTPIWQPPFLWGIESEPFAVILGYGILFSIPNLIKLIKETFGLQSVPLGIGVGTFFQGASSGGGGAMNLLGMFSSIYWGKQALTQSGLLGKAERGPEPNFVQEGQATGHGGKAPWQRQA